jgi:hypothetical protein
MKKLLVALLAVAVMALAYAPGASADPPPLSFALPFTTAEVVTAALLVGGGLLMAWLGIYFGFAVGMPWLRKLASACKPK